jgi:hypothetical protein
MGVLLTLLGHEGLRIYETFTWSPTGDSFKINPVLAKIETHFQSRKSKTYERYKFLNLHQLEGESCETFLLDTQRDSILRDQIGIDVAYVKTREKLLFYPQLTLNKAVEIVRACET